MNRQMVELGALGEEDDERLRALVEEHVARTQSAKGREVLAAWNTYAPRFVRVLPIKYRRVIEARAKALGEVSRHG